MRKGFCLALAASALAFAALAAGQTVEELIQKSIEARGGLEKIRAIRSLRMTGTMSLGDEKAPTVLEFKRPSRVRWEFTVDGETAIQAFDGTTAWALIPFAGDTSPHTMSAEDRKGIELQADIDGPLVDAGKKGHRVELAGREERDGRDAWKLKITSKDGQERLVFLDPKTYLQFLTVSERDVGGRTIEIENRIGDYRPVGDVMLPHSFETSVEDVPDAQTLRFDRIEANVDIDDRRFAMPSEAGER